MIKEALAELGLPADAGRRRHSTEYDEALRASHHAGMDPVGPGRRHARRSTSTAWRSSARCSPGSRAARTPASVFDGARLLAGYPHFFELKRTRTRTRSSTELVIDLSRRRTGDPPARNRINSVTALQSRASCTRGVDCGRGQERGRRPRRGVAPRGATFAVVVRGACTARGGDVTESEISITDLDRLLAHTRQRNRRDAQPGNAFRRARRARPGGSTGTNSTRHAPGRAWTDAVHRLRGADVQLLAL